MKILIVLILAVELGASVAHAEDLKLPTAALILAHAADLATTHQAIQSGRGYESNAIMAGSTSKRIALKAVSTSLTVAGAKLLEKRGHPKLAQGLIYGIAGVTGAIAVQNYARTR